jgi:TonB family protein
VKKCVLATAITMALNAVSFAADQEPESWSGAIRNAVTITITTKGESVSVQDRQLSAGGVDPATFAGPKLLTGNRLNYPKAAVAGMVQGIVVMECLIPESGVVEACRLRVSVADLDKAAADALRQRTYSPARVAGQPRSVVVLFMIQFRPV